MSEEVLELWAFFAVLASMACMARAVYSRAKGQHSEAAFWMSFTAVLLIIVGLP